MVQDPEWKVSEAGDAVGFSPAVGKLIVGFCDVSIASLYTAVSVNVWLPALASASVVRFGVRLLTIGLSVSMPKASAAVNAAWACPPRSCPPETCTSMAGIVAFWSATS